MPVQDGVGHGDLTALKIEHLQRIFGMHIAVTQAVIRKNARFSQHYRYLELTAGKGYTPDGLEGSPLVFLEQVASAKSPLTIQAEFIEQNAENLKALEQSVKEKARKHNWDCSNIKYIHGEYEQVIPGLLPRQNNTELGLVFVDHSGDLANFDTLKYIALRRPKMEILIYLATTNIKRVRHLTDKLLSDYMSLVGKRFWLIRKPIPWDKHKWTFLLGSNTDIFKNYKKIDFLRLDSAEAQSFFPKLNLSKKQRQEIVQPRLFGD